MTPRRTLLLCGIFSPVLYAIADLLAGLQWQDYSFRDHTISELGAIDAPSSPLFSTLVLVAYLLLNAFGVGTWQSAAENRRLRLAGGLLVGLAVFALATGPFVAMRPRGTEQGLAGALHLVQGALAMMILLAAMASAAAAFGRRFFAYTVITIGLVLGFGAWSVMDAPRVEAGLATPWLGAKERIFWYAYQLWFVVLALVLLRRSPVPAGARLALLRNVAGKPLHLAATIAVMLAFMAAATVSLH